MQLGFEHTYAARYLIGSTAPSPPWRVADPKLG